MAPAPVLLLPPSEGKASGGRGRPLRLDRLSFPELADQRDRTIDALARAMRASVASRATLLGVKGDVLADATAANRDLRTAPTMPAIERFTGVLYDELDVASLSARDRKRLDAQVLVFSGVFGLLSPTDAVPDHRCKMNVSLPAIGKVSSAWRAPITEALAPRVAGTTVWNLLPGEHAAAWKPAAVGSAGGPAAMLTVKFLEGALVRFVLATGADEPAALATFRHPQGYVYDPTLLEEVKGMTVVSMVRPA